MFTDARSKLVLVRFWEVTVWMQLVELRRKSSLKHQIALRTKVKWTLARIIIRGGSWHFYLKCSKIIWLLENLT